MILALYVALNVFPVRYYGEFEFWFSSLKVLLILGLILMTFIMMLGGNPNHDRFGFRYWQDPGPMNTEFTTGALGRFLGFWSSLRLAGFTIGGPHFIAMTAPETINPRRNVPKVIKRVFWRIFLFYLCGALCIGIL
jgi:yeast amino acid transporter